MSTLRVTTDGRTIVIPIFEKSVVTIDGIKVMIDKRSKIPNIDESESVKSFLKHSGYAGMDTSFHPEFMTQEIKMFSRDLREEYNMYCMQNKIIQKSKTEFLAIIRSMNFLPKPILRIGSEVSNGFIFHKKI